MSQLIHASMFLKKIKRGFWIFFLLLPVFFFAIFYFLPLTAIFNYSISTPLDKGFESNVWIRVWSPLRFTIWQALLSTLLTTIIGIPAAYVFARFHFRGKGLFRLLTTLPFIMPTVVVAAGFTALMGARGWLNVLLMNVLNLSTPPIQILNTLAAILLAHVFYNTTIFIRVLGGAWSQLDPKLEFAARSLGASGWQVLKNVTLPLLRPAFFSTLLLVFLFDFTSFAVILLLGGPGFATLEVEIYTQALHLLNLPLAGLLSAIQLFFTILITFFYSKLNSKRSVVLKPRDPQEIEKAASQPIEQILLFVVLSFLFIILVIPLISLFVRSFLQYQPINGSASETAVFITLDYYRALFVNQRQSIFYVPPVAAVVNSLWFGSLTVLISLILGFIAARTLVLRNRLTKVYDLILMLPLGTSAVTLGLGFLLVFNKPPIDVRSFPLLIPIAHSLVALPFVVRILLPAMQSFPQIYKQSAAVLGASPWKVWWLVEFPILSPAFLSAGIFSFTISIGEFGATTFLVRADLPTIPIAIYRFLSQPGTLNYGQAMAMATILMVICSLAIFIVERLHLPGLSTL